MGMIFETLTPSILRIELIFTLGYISSSFLNLILENAVVNVNVNVIKIKRTMKNYF